MFLIPKHDTDNRSIDLYDYPFYVIEICTTKQKLGIFNDLEERIRNYPNSCSRFDIGDEVLINPENIESHNIGDRVLFDPEDMEKVPKNLNLSKKHWIEGEVYDVFSLKIMRY